jgi:hypothetical protein
MAIGGASFTLSRFAAPRPSFWFVLYLDETGDQLVSNENQDSICTYFALEKGAEAPDLNSLKLFETRGFSR